MRIRIPLAVVLSTTTIAAAHEPPLPTLGKSIDVNIVNIDVVVTVSNFSERGGGRASSAATSEAPQKCAEAVSSSELHGNDLARATKSHVTYELELKMHGKADRVIGGVLDEVSTSFAVTHVPVPRSVR